MGYLLGSSQVRLPFFGSAGLAPHDLAVPPIGQASGAIQASPFQSYHNTNAFVGHFPHVDHGPFVIPGLAQPTIERPVRYFGGGFVRF